MTRLPVPFVKICGVTNPSDARAAATAGASAIGLVLAPSSRRVDLDEADRIARSVAGETLRVLVVRNQPDDEVLAGIEAVDADGLQVHGPLSATVLAAARAKGLFVVQALTIDGAEFDRYDEADVDGVLIDGPRPGSGEVHGWQRLATRTFERPVIGAGGLTPDNVAATIRALALDGVDVSSGVERRPGEKDHDLVASFVANARAAFASGREV